MSLRNFFVRNGKTLITFVAVSGSCLGVLTYQLLPQTVFLHRLREAHETRRNGKVVPVKDSILQLVAKAASDINLNVHLLSYLDAFTCNGNDVLQHGSIFSKGMYTVITGANIGIPDYFQAESIEELKNSQIMIDDTPIELSSKEGSQFLDSLFLSERAKCFAIAQKLYMLQTVLHIIKPVTSGALVLFTYYICHDLNKYFKTFDKGFPKRLALYFTVCNISLLSYFTWNELCHWESEIYGDKLAAMTNKDYALGGVEYYSKLIQRNILIQKMAGDSRKLYTTDGNKYTLTSVKTKLTTRRERLLRIVEEFEDRKKTKI